MKSKTQKDFQTFPLIIGVCLGFFLGIGMVYWYFDRQNDKIVNEFLEKKMSNFQSDEREITDSNYKGSSLQSTSIRNKRAVSKDNEDFFLQDKLLYTKTVSLQIEENNHSQEFHQLDSMLGNPGRNIQQSVYYLEFWESPLNSMGYKMGKNKIMFYGIYLFDLANIYYRDKRLYLEYLNHHYPLNATSTFQPLESVNTDLVLTEKLP